MARSCSIREHEARELWWSISSGEMPARATFYMLDISEMLAFNNLPNVFRFVDFRWNGMNFMLSGSDLVYVCSKVRVQEALSLSA